MLLNLCPCAARLGVMIAEIHQGSTLPQDAAGGCYISACCFDLYSVLVQHALGFDGIPPLGVDALSGQMRQVVAAILPGQVADGGSEDGRWSKSVERAAHATR